MSNHRLQATAERGNERGVVRNGVLPTQRGKHEDRVVGAVAPGTSPAKKIGASAFRFGLLVDRRIFDNSTPLEADHMPTPVPELIDIETLASRLGDSVRHVRRLVAERRIPYLRVGRFIRFDPDEIAQWLDSSRQPVQR